MNFVPPGILATMSIDLLNALDDLEHNCDLINARPTAMEVCWTLERAGASRLICDAVWPERQS